MFKKRIKAAYVALVTLFVLTLLSIIGWKFSETRSTRVGKIKVLSGTLDAVEGVEVSIGNYEYVSNTSGIGELALASTMWDCIKSTITKVSEGQVFTKIDFDDKAKSRYKYCYVGVSANFPQKYVVGMHPVSGKEFSFDLKGFLFNLTDSRGEVEYVFPNYITFADDDHFFYEGEEKICLNGIEIKWDTTSYYSSVLCEMNGSVYGYVDVMPEKEFDLSEVHMTVNKGIYRYDVNGTAECVFLMGERGDGFSRLWLTANEENNALRIIGAKENKLLMYECSLETGTVNETVLWNGDDGFSEWYEEADKARMGDVVTKGERTWLCYTDINMEKVKLEVFEDGDRIFEGELQGREYEDMENLYNFSMKNNFEFTIDDSVDMVEIRLTE